MASCQDKTLRPTGATSRRHSGSMTRRQRLMATLRGEPVDRPAVSFYELNGLDEDPGDPNNLDPNQDGIACALLPTLLRQEAESMAKLMQRGLEPQDKPHAPR